jgi:DNA polymerase III delta subunit
MLTKTSAMQQALQALDIPCWHGVSAFSRLADCSEWCAALDAKFFNQGLPFTRERWDRLLSDFGAVSDVPAIAFAEDLVAAYPEAKVILVERNRDAWFNSFNEAVIGPCWIPVLQFIARCEIKTAAFGPIYIGQAPNIR